MNSVPVYFLGVLSDTPPVIAYYSEGQLFRLCNHLAYM